MRSNIHSFQIVRNSALGNNVVNISGVLTTNVSSRAMSSHDKCVNFWPPRSLSGCFLYN